ncbi:MAG: aminotransferase class V-fold PLP-dependent enzyme [Ilumatobacteraceae bacterium]
MCPAAEHHAVREVVEANDGIVVPVTSTGAVDLDALAEALTTHGDRAEVVSVMAVNNELGTVTELAEVAATVRRCAPGALLHTDAVQAAMWLDLRSVTAHVDLLSLSAHKFGGPKGVGVLWIRRGVAIDPLVRGGGQERDRRSGTQNVAGVVGAATALRLTDEDRPTIVASLTVLRDRLLDGLIACGAIETVPRSVRVAGNAHVCFPGLESEELLYLLDRDGVSASAASACASGAIEASHVLRAIAVSEELRRGALRLTLGHTTTAADVDHALAVVAGAVARLRDHRARQAS